MLRGTRGWKLQTRRSDAKRSHLYKCASAGHRANIRALGWVDTRPMATFRFSERSRGSFLIVTRVMLWEHSENASLENRPFAVSLRCSCAEQFLNSNARYSIRNSNIRTLMLVAFLARVIVIYVSGSRPMSISPSFSFCFLEPSMWLCQWIFRMYLSY